MRTIFIAVGLLALTGATMPLMAQEGAVLTMRLEAMLEDFQDRYTFPGATAAIAPHDGTVVTAARGLADVENARAMTAETPMLAASIGKTFVAAAVLALESEGSMSRADLPSAHLGDRPWFDALPKADRINALGILYGAGVAIYAETRNGTVYGHGGWIPAYVSSLRHYVDHGVTVAFQVNTDIGIMDDTSTLVPALEAVLAELAIEAVQ